MTARKLTSLRISEDAEQYVAKLAEDAGVVRAVALRAMLSVATQHDREVRAKLAATKGIG